MTTPKHNYVPGKAYETRSNAKIFYVGENPIDSNHPLIFVRGDGGITCHRHDGTFSSSDLQHAWDIIGEWPPEPKKVKGWINIYLYDHGESMTLFYKTKESANEDHKKYYYLHNITACIPIEFTEGEGL